MCVFVCEYVYSSSKDSENKYKEQTERQTIVW